MYRYDIKLFWGNILHLWRIYRDKVSAHLLNLGHDICSVMCGSCIDWLDDNYDNSSICMRSVLHMDTLNKHTVCHMPRFVGGNTS